MIYFILLIGLLILVHELGHWIAARLLKVKVLRISIGLGPALLSLRRGDTEYALGALPLGGYVRLVGEDSPDAVAPADRPGAFCLRPAWQRLAIILAGPLANLALAVVLLSQVYAARRTALSATLGTVLAGQPAADADLRPGDRVVEVDGAPIRYWEEFHQRVLGSPNHELKLTIERSGEAHALARYVTPRAHLRTDALGGRERVGLIGVTPHVRLPQIGVSPRSAAFRAGLRSFDLVIAAQGRPLKTAAELERVFTPRRGEMLVVTYLRPASTAFGFAPVAALTAHSVQIVPDRVAGGYDTGIHPADLYVYNVDPGTPAAALGLTAGDRLVALDGAPLIAWELLEQAVEEHPRDQHSLTWVTAGGDQRSARFRPVERRRLDEYQSESTSYFFGAQGGRAVESVAEVAVDPDPWRAVERALRRTAEVTAMMSRVLALTVTGRLPASAIGGPILIYQVAGVAAQHGAEPFLAIASVVSLNLGLLNLLPVPLLDGGQVMLVLLEAIRRRPISAPAQRRASYVGLALLLALLLLASGNDLVRHFLP